MADLAGARRTDRQVGWLISLGGAVLVLGQVLTGLPPAEDTAAWWLAGVALMAIAVLCLAALGRVLPFGLLRIGWIGIPVLGWVLWATSFLAYRADPAEAGMPWIWMLQSVVASYPVLWVRPMVAVGLTVVSGCLPALSALVFLGGLPQAVAADTPIHLTNIMFVAIFVGIRNRLTRLRRSEQRAREQDLRSARAVAEAQRQAQLGRLIHDEVLSVLIAARSFDGEPPPQLRAEATHALLLLDAPAPGTRGAERIDCRDALAVMTATLRRIDPACALRAEAASGAVPAAAADAVTLAAAEALRNSVRHAGPGAARQLAVRVRPGDIEVVVRDDGRGFDPAAVPAERLGLRQSVVARMSDLAGGDVRVLAAPGSGAEVVLTWRT